MSFNLDTILLSLFIKTRKSDKKIVDVGTGNGALMLYLSEKTKAKIIGVEIQEKRYHLALENIKLNSLEDQLSCHHIDYNEIDFMKDIDMVVSNPPFFKVNQETKRNLSLDSEIARHEIYLNLEQLIKKTSQILKHGGSFYMIHRPDRLTDIMNLCNKFDLVVKEIQFVHPYIHKEPNHLLIKAVKKGNEGVKILPPLVIYQSQNEYTEYFKAVYSKKD
ncbi:tRNA1(Val) (adenine(37)-N6)-methyltransferase [Acholeplasma palmae]|nr:methyltransferase [Alteracholeplasma palmae]